MADNGEQQAAAVGGAAEGAAAQQAAGVAAAAAAAAPAAGGQGQQEQQQQGEEQAGGAQDGPAADANAEAGEGADGEGPAAKRQRVGPTFSYEPASTCDLVLRTSDGKRVGVHRLIVLRTCGFFKTLLDTFEGESEVTVTESYDELRSLLLDIIYDRSVSIQPETALQVFQLADKYEAPSLMQACRAVFLSDAFRLGIPACGEAGEVEGHCNWIDMLALASKHKYTDLFDQCTAFFLRLCQERPALALESFHRDRAQLPNLESTDLMVLLLGLAKCSLLMDSKTAEDLKAAQKALKDSQKEVEELKKKLDSKSASFMKLLGKYNRLLDKCDKHQVTWHKEVEAVKKGGKKRGAAGGGAAQAAQAAAAGGGAAQAVQAAAAGAGAAADPAPAAAAEEPALAAAAALFGAMGH